MEKKIKGVEKKFPDITGLAATVFLNRKINEVNNKIPNASKLVKKADYYNKIKEFEINISLQLILINLRVKHLMSR